MSLVTMIFNYNSCSVVSDGMHTLRDSNNNLLIEDENAKKYQVLNGNGYKAVISLAGNFSASGVKRDGKIIINTDDYKAIMDKTKSIIEHNSALKASSEIINYIENYEYDFEYSYIGLNAVFLLGDKALGIVVSNHPKSETCKFEVNKDSGFHGMCLGNKLETVKPFTDFVLDEYEKENLAFKKDIEKIRYYNEIQQRYNHLVSKVDLTVNDNISQEIESF